MAETRKIEWRAAGTLFLALSCALWLAGCNDSHSPVMASSANSAAVSAEKAQDKTAQKAPQDASRPAAGGEAASAASAATASNEPAPETTAAAAKPADEPRRLPTADITFDDIKFDIQPDEPFERKMLSEKIEKLAGRTIRIRGFILPSFQQTGLTQFVLVRDNLSCCFGPGAALYDCIVVEMKPGKSTDFSLYPVAVEGAFTIREFKDPSDPDGKVLAIYHLDGESVR